MFISCPFSNFLKYSLYELKGSEINVHTRQSHIGESISGYQKMEEENRKQLLMGMSFVAEVMNMI